MNDSKLYGSDANLTYPIIIMRSGGLDGVALQAREYRHLLNRLDINVHVITGRHENKFSSVNQIGLKQTVINRLDFHDETSQLLFANQFEHGPEKEDIAEISRDQWIELFHEHKNKIRDRIDAVLQKIPYNTPVLVYNMISLRHAHPAAAAAIRELMRKYPNRAFISHSADPDAERPEKTGRIKDFVLPLISASEAEEPYSGGPYNLANLYHIVLNPAQYANFINKYHISGDHIFEIPDFLEFVSAEPNIMERPKRIFLDFMSERCLQSNGKSYNYHKRDFNCAETVVFLSPVRPVYRKRLKEGMLAAKEYGTSRGVATAYVVTHPNTDDKQYFFESLRFAETIGLPFYHLGKTFTLETLDSVYENLAACKCIGVIASSAGGWENALNEMARECIPFCMDYNLNSYKPLTEEIGMKTHGFDFSVFTDAVRRIEETGRYQSDSCSGSGRIEQLLAWVDSMLRPEERLDLVVHNYRKAYDYLSHDATLPKLVNSINYIFARHGHPPIF